MFFWSRGTIDIDLCFSYNNYFWENLKESTNFTGKLCFLFSLDVHLYAYVNRYKTNPFLQLYQYMADVLLQLDCLW